MKEIVSAMKNITICEPMVTIRATMKDEDVIKLNELVDNMLMK